MNLPDLDLFDGITARATGDGEVVFLKNDVIVARDTIADLIVVVEDEFLPWLREEGNLESDPL